MKKIAKYQIEPNFGALVIDRTEVTNVIPFYGDYSYALDYWLDQTMTYTKLYEHIIVKDFNTIPANLLSALTLQYLHGATITFENPKKDFSRTYKAPKPAYFYRYFWEELDLTAPVPRTLAEFKFMYNGKQTTYLDAISTLNSTRYLPNEIWNALDDYSQKLIASCRELNRGDYSLAETWFKNIIKDTEKTSIKVYSPNPKSKIEADAELKFEKQCKVAQLKEGLRELTDEELEFLHKYAPAYGIEIPKFRWRINTRKCGKYGSTVEPEVVSSSTIYDSRQVYDRDAKRRPNLPKEMRNGLRVREADNAKFLRDAYTQLLWVIKHLGDEGLVPGYKRCPECHEIYREHEGCECGACPGIEIISADNLFYSNAESYEDWDSTEDYINNL